MQVTASVETALETREARPHLQILLEDAGMGEE